MKHKLTSAFILATAFIFGGCQLTSSLANPTAEERLRTVKRKLDEIDQKLAQTKNAITVFIDPETEKSIDLSALQITAAARKKKAERLFNQIADMQAYDNQAGVYKPDHMPDFLPCINMMPNVSTPEEGLALAVSLVRYNKLDDVQSGQDKLWKSYKTLQSVQADSVSPEYLHQLSMLETDIMSHQSFAEIVIDITNKNISMREKSYANVKGQEHIFHQNFSQCEKSFDEYKDDRKRNALNIT